MARKGVTYDQVANAAAAIKARGSEPTISAIRVELGNEGSYTTISQHLAKWKETSADKVDAKDLPPEVENKMLEALMVVWNIANKLAQDDVSAIKQNFEDKEEEITGELKDAKSEIEALEKEIERLTAQIEKQQKEIETAEKKITSLEAKEEATRTLYQELAASIQPKQHDDTKKARPQRSKPSAGNKQAETPQS